MDAHSDATSNNVDTEEFPYKCSGLSVSRGPQQRGCHESLDINPLVLST